MTVMSRGSRVGALTPVASHDLFTPVGGHFPLNAGSPVDVSSAVVLSPGNFGVNDPVDRVLIQTTAQNIRYTLDGTTPTATNGFQLKSTDDPRLIMLLNGVVLTVIEEAATAAVNFQFGR